MWLYTPLLLAPAGLRQGHEMEPTWATYTGSQNTEKQTEFLNYLVGKGPIHGRDKSDRTNASQGRDVKTQLGRIQPETELYVENTCQLYH